MMTRLKMILFCLAIGANSCSGDDVGSSEPIAPGNEEKKTDIYPKPPSGWMGESNPYPTTGWVGDIMPYYDNGQFHLFFLHDAQSKPAGEGFHAIHKFESSNLADFSYEGEAVPYGSSAEPDFAIGTGSPVKVGDTYYFYYTGHNGNASFVQNNPRESVLLATSTNLETWTKEEDFILTAPPGYYDYDFRDPHVFFNEEANEYWMLMSTQIDASRKAVVLLFTSQDPATHAWEPQEPVYTTSEEENYLMMECVDMFKMGDYWYMFFSENWGVKGTHYRIATSSKGPWTTPENDMLDGEFYYAAKTAADGNKRYLFGWTARRAPEANTGNKEWAGNMVTHELIQRVDGTLGLTSPETVSGLFSDPVTLQTLSEQEVSRSDASFQLSSNEQALAIFSPLGGARKLEAQMTLESGSGSAGFVFNADGDQEQAYEILFEPENSRIAAYSTAGGGSQLVTEVPVNLESGRQYQVEVFVEGSICVVYLNGEVALSNRIYGVEDQEWGLIAKETTATFDNMQLLKP